MVWEAISSIVGVVGLVTGGLGYMAKREADRVLAPRVDCNSYLDDNRKSVTNMYRIAGENAEHWSVESVRVSSANAKVAPVVSTGVDDGYGNTLRGKGPWDTYLDLNEVEGEYYGFVTAPADQPVHLIFTLSAKSDFNIKRDAPVLIRAQTQNQ